MGSTWGRQLKMTLFGESHGSAIGVTLDGLPAGCPVDLDRIQAFMDRRAPGRTPWSTPRKEADRVDVLSGLYQGRTTGAPLTAVIHNTNTRSGDYKNLAERPRPGHADLTALMRYDGAADGRGGGHFSGRLTAPLTFAGALALDILAPLKIGVAARIQRLAGIDDVDIDLAAPPLETLRQLPAKTFPTVSDTAGQRMIEAVEAARLAADSVGGVVEVFAYGFPPGIGDPFFGGVEPQLASLYYGIPAVKGVSFGDGFLCADRRGSVNNDAPVVVQGDGRRPTIRMATNHAGGADGGITTGMPIVARLAFKPTPSIGSPQSTVDLGQLSNTTLTVTGRHDPCIVPRAVPVVEAATAVGLLDLWLVANGIQGSPAPR